MSCSCVCAPGLLAEKPRLELLGGDWLGCCGDPNHTYGFHLPSCACAPDDYSLRYGPGNPAWACAGDFGMGWRGSREWLARLVQAVRTDPMYLPVVEIIGSLDGTQVLYWCRWNGWKTESYTGAGHDTWTHISYNRELAGKDLNLLGGQLMADIVYDKTDKQRVAATNARVEAQAQGKSIVKKTWEGPTGGDEPQWLVNQVKALAEVTEDQGAVLARVEAKLDQVLAMLQPSTSMTFPTTGTVTYQVIP
jgi:hypothetical protein